MRALLLLLAAALGAQAGERPSELIQKLREMGLKPGDLVAQIGCGAGSIARLLAREVGPSGKVYCEDIRPEMLALARQRAAAAGLENMTFVLGTDVDPRLPRQALAWVVLFDTCHELRHPEPVLARIRDSLAPGGRVALLEDGEDGEHRMPVEQVLAAWTRAGFLLLKRDETLPARLLFVFSAKRGARPLP